MTATPARSAKLYDAHSRLLFGLILRILKDRGDAGRCCRKSSCRRGRANTYNLGLGSPLGWLLGIARNRAIDRLRRRSAHVRAVDAAAEPLASDDPEHLAELEERRRSVQDALDALPRDQRDLIEQAYFLGLTHSELAARFSLPLGTVKTRIRAGMVSLRGHLEPRWMEQ